MHNNELASLDKTILEILKKISVPSARLAIFIIFFWFGALKLFGDSPANPLVQGLMEKTIPFMTFHQFIIFFGVYEMIIGLAFLVPNLERLAIALLVPHMITTFLPLILLPAVTWQGFLTPTLEGQYIIKNLVIIALALSLIGQIKPMRTDGIMNNE